MTAWIALMGLAALSGQGREGWVWTYYDGGGAAVLAREIPDTERLSAVLECQPGSGLARLTVYGPAARPGFVGLSAGDVTADAERVEADGLAVALRTDHPVFEAFAGGAALSVNADGETLRLPAPDAGAAGRFRAACGGAS